MPKTKIEDIHVDAKGGSAVMWRIGSDRFHVWLRRDGPDDTIYKNSIANHDEPGYYRTRQLTREGSKVAAAMFNEVWAVVERDGLVAKAEAEETAKNARFARINVAQAEIRAIEQQVLAAWRAGHFNASDAAAAFHQRFEKLNADIAAEG